MLAQLASGSPLISGPPPAVSDTVERSVLEQALADPMRAPAAAFVAGRVVADGDARLGEELRSALRSILDGLDPRQLDSRGPACVEAAMGMALLGDVPTGQAFLAAAASEDASVPIGKWTAASYLAQMGDPGGFPAMVAMLHDPDGFTRLMAARHLIAFLPYDGQAVADETVDVERLLVDRLDDPDPLVSQEIPGLLAELAPPDLAGILKPVAKRHRHKPTRRAAASVLQDLSEGGGA